MQSLRVPLKDARLGSKFAGWLQIWKGNQWNQRYFVVKVNERRKEWNEERGMRNEERGKRKEEKRKEEGKEDDIIISHHAATMMTSNDVIISLICSIFRTTTFSITVLRKTLTRNAKPFISSSARR
jgi:hypothetical protein